MVLLDQDRVIQTRPVVVRSTGGHSGLLQCPQTRCRLARVEHLRSGSLHLLGGTRRERRHARQMAEDVQSDALAREQGPRRALDREHRPLFLAPAALLRQALEADAGIEQAKGDLCRIEAIDHAGGLLRDQRPRARIRLDRGLGRDVPAADVLGQRAPHQLGQLLLAHRHTEPIGCEPSVTSG